MERLKKVLDEVLSQADYEDCEDFIEEGLLDSMEMMELVEALEDEFGIEISGRDIVPENFTNMETIAELIRKYDGDL